MNILNFISRLYPKSTHESDLNLSPERFDVMAKYLYAKYRNCGRASKWYRQLYLEHIKVWNNFHEKGKWTGEEKNGKSEFIRSFDSLLDSISKNGFDPNLSKVWVDREGNLVNGAHRLAACLFYKCPFVVEVHPAKHGQKNCDYKYFLGKDNFVKGGLARKYTDRMALEYVGLKKSTYGVLVFPAAVGHDELIEKLVRKYAGVVYTKEVKLNQTGAFNLMKIIYKGEKWLGDINNNFEGAWSKVRPCFPDGSSQPLRFMIIDTDNKKGLPRLKAEIRSIFNIGNHSVHINDTHKETLEISQMLLNDNSVHFLNNSKLDKSMVNFLKLFEIVKKNIKNKNIDAEDFCITASGVLAAYGIRDCMDLDYLSKSSFKKPNKMISSHDTELKYYNITADEVIELPLHHFYLEGVKFLSIDNLQAFKKCRGENKDITDVNLINNYL